MTSMPPELRATIEIYLRAWVTQDADLIVTIFTPDATYHERVLDAPIRGIDGIRRYWETKVIAGQANIEATLLNLYLDSSQATAIAEWEASFDDLVDGRRKLMREVAILEIEGGRIAGLREYWTSR